MTAIRHTVAFTLPFEAGSSGEQAFLAEARALTAIPEVVAYLALQRLFERGLSAGAIK